MHRYAQNEFENQAIIRKSYDEKQKVYSSEYELTRLFRSAASMNRTNLISILVSGASAVLYFR